MTPNDRVYWLLEISIHLLCHYWYEKFLKPQKIRTTCEKQGKPIMKINKFNEYLVFMLNVRKILFYDDDLQILMNW